MTLDDLIALADRFRQAGIGRTGPVSIYERHALSRLEAVIYEPVLCLVLQGGKVTAAGDHAADLTAGDALVVSHDLPVLSRITDASADRPYIAVIVQLDLSILRGLYAQLDDAPTGQDAETPLAAARAEPALIDSLARYLSLAFDPRDAQVLGPGILREIHYRLLMSPVGANLRRLTVADSHASRVARAIAVLRDGFRGPLSVADLAGAAGMSQSSFHTHFKAVTGHTPLQYQKDLRLIEARTRLQQSADSISAAAFAVGYESPTQFSREYRRKFGRPPSAERAAAG